ncbi:hypothetical protein NWQ34_01140 [Mycoplasmopsis felis]|nr:potassium transporter TrkG [Mycoplasmopsis felis]MCU9938316.1 hypothetical protein [Mycoplasmopsis felis]
MSKYLKNQYINPQGNWSLAFRFGYFHTISAINNAGFDIISNRSIMPYYLNYGLQIWIIVLVIGGIGYPTIYDFHKFLKRKLRELTKKEISLFFVFKSFYNNLYFSFTCRNDNNYKFRNNFS